MPTAAEVQAQINAALERQGFALNREQRRLAQGVVSKPKPKPLGSGSSSSSSSASSSLKPVSKPAPLSVQSGYNSKTGRYWQVGVRKFESEKAAQDSLTGGSGVVAKGGGVGSHDPFADDDVLGAAR